MILKNNPPVRKPTVAGSHAGTLLSAASSMEGASRDQKLTAIMTPPAKPSTPPSSLRDILLTTNTEAAPKAAMDHVKQAAKKACNTGEMPLKNSSILDKVRS